MMPPTHFGVTFRSISSAFESDLAKHLLFLAVFAADEYAWELVKDRTKARGSYLRRYRFPIVGALVGLLRGFEVLHGGKVVDVGALDPALVFRAEAQRRRREGLLIQGSIQPPPLSLAKADWQKAMCDVAHFEQQIDWLEFVADAALHDRAQALAEEKYSQSAYNQRR